MSEEGLPILPHLSGEFFAWLWWTSERHGAFFELEPDVGTIELWVDARLAFRNPEDTRVAAVLTGENPSATLEAKAALAGGKVLQDLRVGIRREDREFFVTLKGPAMHLNAVKLPQVVSDGGEEVLYDRLHLYEELNLLVAALFRSFASVRTSEEWSSTVVPQLQQWILGDD